MRVRRAYLEESVTAEQTRRLSKGQTGQTRRSWKVMRPANTPPRPKMAWDKSIADVARQ